MKAANNLAKRDFIQLLSQYRDCNAEQVKEMSLTAVANFAMTLSRRTMARGELNGCVKPWCRSVKERLESDRESKMETLWKNLTYSVRMLLKRPSLTIVAIIAMGLGIGANTAIFSVVNTVLLRPLPFQQPEQLVTLAT
jgi:putative ABC transport system permease protein